MELASTVVALGDYPCIQLVELMVIFIMGMVSPVFPISVWSKILPIAGSLMSSEWNNPQSEWSRYVVPY